MTTRSPTRSATRSPNRSPTRSPKPPRPTPQPRQAQREDAYARPDLYDIVHTPGTAEDLSAHVRVLQDVLNQPRLSARHVLWIEPGCGSGRFLRVLKARGAAAVGFDLDRGMVRAATRSLRATRGTGPVHAVVGDMIHADAPALRRAVARAARQAGPIRAVVAFNPHNSVRHLDSDDALTEHLASIARLLSTVDAPSVYLVGTGLVAPPGSPGGEQSCETVFTVTRGGVRVREITDFLVPEPDATGPDARTERAFKHVSVFAKRPGQRRFDAHPVREMISSYALRTYTLAQWTHCVHAAGLRETAVFAPAGAWVKRLTPARLHYAIRVLRPPLRR